MSSALGNIGVKGANGTSVHVQNNLHVTKDQDFTTKMFFEGKSMIEYSIQKNDYRQFHFDFHRECTCQTVKGEAKAYN